MNIKSQSAAHVARKPVARVLHVAAPAGNMMQPAHVAATRGMDWK